MSVISRSGALAPISALSTSTFYTSTASIISPNPNRSKDCYWQTRLLQQSCPVNRISRQNTIRAHYCIQRHSLGIEPGAIIYRTLLSVHERLRNSNGGGEGGRSTVSVCNVHSRHCRFAKPSQRGVGFSRSSTEASRRAAEVPVRETARDLSNIKGGHERKAAVGLTEESHRYVLQHTREPQVLKLLREETSTLHGSQMQVSPDQAQHLAFLASIIGAKRCIEVGVYTGYSALAVALSLPEDGLLVACDRSGSSFEVAKKYFTLAGVSHKVDIRIGLARDTLESLLAAGEATSYDFAFIDADKRSYREYYELLLKLVRPGGVIAVDNVLWHGKVADPQVTDLKTQSLRDFNSFVLQDERVSVSMVAIGDGMTLCHKR